MAVILAEPGRQILLRHEQAARVEVADVERDQLSTVVVLGNVVDRSRAAKPVHYAEADRVTVKHRLKHAADGALLGPHLAAGGLLVPEVAAIRSRDAAGVCGGVGPSRHPLNGASLVDDPLPRDVALLARLFEQAVDPLHFRTS